MAVSMLARHRRSGEHEELPICSMGAFDTYWEPAARTLDLQMIQCLTSLWLTPEIRARLLMELHFLRAFVESGGLENSYAIEMIERIDSIAHAVTRLCLDEYDVSFG
jgi:hypothetical protein